MFALCWEYLAGRAVATDPNDREKAEWPPHPDRVFQALVAAWAGEGRAEREALAWLSTLEPPQLSVPANVAEAAVVKTFVPVNDIEGPRRGAYAPKHIGLLPIARKRSPRFFPAINVGDGVCALVWPDVDVDLTRREVLERVCRAVTYLGHSSSLVRMWICDQELPVRYVPVARRPQLMLRVPSPGRLDALERAYRDGGPGWTRPPVATWQGYASKPTDDIARGGFDDRLIVMRQASGPRLTLAQTLLFARALRGTLIKAADGSPSAIRMLSGHEADGSPLMADHTAYLPLAWVSDPASAVRHADGHLLGAALAIPRGIDGDTEQAVLDALAIAGRSAGGRLRVALGPVGVVELETDVSARPPQTLQVETWTRPSRLWGTVTPIVLDRMPPRRHPDHHQWASEQIESACGRQGIPAPAAIEITPAAPHLGAPGAASFPALRRKDGTRRWHLHVRLRFEVAVCGPVLLGAGRFQGYGLCKPLSEMGRS